MPDYPLGPGHVCIDASALISFADAGELVWLATWFHRAFTAEVITTLELPKGREAYPAVGEILKQRWLEPVRVEDEDDVLFVAKLLALWGSNPGHDEGEAEIVVLCRRFGWTAILDDHRGRDAADREAVARVNTPTMIVAATAGTNGDIDEMWGLYQRVCDRLDRPIIPTADPFAVAFRRAVGGMKRIIEDSDEDPWPNVLTDPRLEALCGRAAAMVRTELES